MGKTLKKSRLFGKKRIYLDLIAGAISSWIDECYLVEAEKEARSVGLSTKEEFLTPKQIDEIAESIYKHIQIDYFIS